MKQRVMQCQCQTITYPSQRCTADLGLGGGGVSRSDESPLVDAGFAALERLQRITSRFLHFTEDIKDKLLILHLRKPNNYSKECLVK